MKKKDLEFFLFYYFSQLHSFDIYYLENKKNESDVSIDLEREYFKEISNQNYRTDIFNREILLKYNYETYSVSSNSFNHNYDLFEECF